MDRLNHSLARFRPLRALALFAVAVLLLSLPLLTANAAPARHDGTPAPGAHDEQPTDEQLLAQVGFDQNLNAQMPIDVPMIDEQGRDVTLAQYLGKKPAILVFTYYDCPNLCPLILHGLTESLRTMQVPVGNDFDVIVTSIDPKETPEQATGAKASILAAYGRWGTQNGWHFLTAPESSTQQMAGAAGFHYALDPKTGEYAHPSGILVLTKDGHISKYLYGLEFSPRDLRLALVDASEGKIGTAVDKLLLACFHYDPSRGRYSLAIKQIMQFSAVLTSVVVGAMVIVLNRRNRKTSPPAQQVPDPVAEQQTEKEDSQS